MLQAYQFALDRTPGQGVRVAVAHCGAQRKVFNWGLAQIKDTVAQREAERSYGITAEELAPSLTWSA